MQKMQEAQKSMTGLVLFLILVGIGLIWVFMQPRLRPVIISTNDPPKISVDQENISVGQLQPKAPFHSTLTLFNTGGASAYIKKIHLDPGLSLQHPIARVIRSAGYRDIPLIGNAPHLSGEFTRRVLVETTDKQKPTFQFILHGVVKE